MTWIHRVIIVPLEYVEVAKAACEQLAGSGGSGMFSCPLSSDGKLPVTHFMSSGLIEDSFAYLLSSPEALETIAVANDIDPLPLLTVIEASDISEEDPSIALSRLGLVIYNEEAE